MRRTSLSNQSLAYTRKSNPFKKGCKLKLSLDWRSRLCHFTLSLDFSSQNTKPKDTLPLLQIQISFIWEQGHGEGQETLSAPGGMRVQWTDSSGLRSEKHCYTL